MNERIRLLAEQAKVSVITTSGMKNILDGCYIVSPDKLAKFAELIVQECARIVEDDGSSVLPLVIKKHFGVEE